MANATGILQALIKQKHRDATEQAYKARTINVGTIGKFNGITTHHDYNALSGVEKTLYLEFLSDTALDYLSTKQGTPRLLYSRKPIIGGCTNDATYQTSVKLLGTGVRCPAHSTWRNMLERCYSGKLHLKHPTYIGCTLAPEWYSFMTFREWWLQHYRDNWQLDKDLLVSGNKLYSPSTCIFIPQWLNLFTTSRQCARGLYPLGVSLDTRQKTKPYQATCANNAGKRVNLGQYATPEEAHQAWLNYKLSIVDARSAELEAIMVGLTDKVKAKVLSLV